MIADALFLIILFINLFWGYKRGFMRSALRLVTTVASLVISFLLAKPVALLLDSNFNLVEKITPWLDEHAGFLSNFFKENQGKVTLFLLTFVGLFIAIRLALIIVDHLLRKLKDSSKAVDFLDKTLGFLFGLVMAAVYIIGLFFTFDSLASISVLSDLPKWVQLTEDGGGFFAWRTYEVTVNHILPVIKDMITGVTSWALEQTGVNVPTEI
ncbi:MAG: CvpA family protein [Christensenellaceae bacterium]|jgi:uncharacterized membrane protein required for colicin V production|nr:CvpA family protein [Christensenellaceae bacterium]